MLAQKQRASKRAGEKLDTLLRMLLAFFLYFFYRSENPKIMLHKWRLEGVVSQSSPRAISLVPFSFSLSLLLSPRQAAISWILDAPVRQTFAFSQSRSSGTCRLTVMEFPLRHLTLREIARLRFKVNRTRRSPGGREVGNLKTNFAVECIVRNDQLPSFYRDISSVGKFSHVLFGFCFANTIERESQPEGQEGCD